MAEYGLKVNNPSGIVVIDGTYSNLALRSSGIFDMTGATSTGSAYQKTFTLTAVTPVLALSCDSSVKCAVASISQNGTTVTVVIETQAIGPVSYYLFDNPVYGAAFNIKYGLIVRNKTTGAVVFDSRLKYMRVLDFIVGSASGSGYPSTSKSYAGVTKIAVVQCARKMYATTTVTPGSPPLLLIIDTGGATYTASGNTITLSSFLRWQIGPTANITAYNQDLTDYAYLVLDLSNY